MNDPSTQPLTRRQILTATAGALAAAPVLAAFQPQHQGHVPTPSPTPTKPPPPALPPTQPAAPTAATAQGALPYAPVVMPDIPTLPFEMDNGVKVFRLVAEPVQREFAPGVVVNCWGYNGQSPGPMIEAVEGDRIRLLVTNNLPEGIHTSMHWHGILLPNGMDGVGGLTQKHIRTGETFKYEYALRQHGTYMYHPHFDEMFQMGLGLMGMFVIHPRDPSIRRVDRDFAIIMNEWLVKPGSATPDPTEMTNFNLFTFNGRMFPGTAPLVARLGEKVRIRIGNLSMTNAHPIHLHGYSFNVTGTDGGPIRESAQWPEVTTNVPTGAARDIEFIADAEGDWAFHCHKVHHLMNGMGHNLPLNLGVRQDDLAARLAKRIPGYMPMPASMSAMMEMGRPPNTIGSAFPGPFDEIDAGGMFTVVKVRKDIASYDDPGWYQHPEGTVAEPV
ncbi:MAG: copper oxidase [Phycisphaerales bacterium]|jgi:FtsP/CotA-like multicopper oxidase with cupredoxin domain